MCEARSSPIVSLQFSGALLYIIIQRMKANLKPLASFHPFHASNAEKVHKKAQHKRKTDEKSFEIVN